MGHEGMRYSLPSRELIADSVEVMTQAHRLDGLVLISNCDKVTPGMLMAAARLNIPAISLTGGAMQSGNLAGEKIGVTNMFEAMGKVYADKMNPNELKSTRERCLPRMRLCNGMFTANTMACLTEALGMSLPGCGTALANSAKKQRIGERNGHANRETRQGRPEAARKFSRRKPSRTRLPWTWLWVEARTASCTCRLLRGKLGSRCRWRSMMRLESVCRICAVWCRMVHLMWRIWIVRVVCRR